MKVVVLLVGFVILSPFFLILSTDNVVADPPIGNETLIPTDDLDISPYVEYPGTFGVDGTWYTYNYTALDSFADVLAQNNTDMPVIYDRHADWQWHHLKMEMSDVEMDWNAFEISLWIRVGLNTGNWSYHIQGDGIDIFDWGTGLGLVHTTYSVNPSTGLPWTATELDSITITIWVYDTTSPQLGFTGMNLLLTPTESQPAPTTFYIFPDAVTDYLPNAYYGDNSNWTCYGETNEADCINEKISGGDAYDTYIQSNDSVEGTVVAVSFENLPSSASISVYYNLTFFVIVEHNGGPFGDDIGPRNNHVYITPIVGPPDENWGSTTPETQHASINLMIYGFWTNQTHLVPTSPDTGTSWTRNEINALQLIIEKSDEYFEYNITQIGVKAEAGAEYQYSYTPDTETFQNTFLSVTWMLITFFPAIVFGLREPTIGFCIGMGIMLLILGLSQANFLPVTLLGFIAIGAVLYKRG